MHPLTLPLRIGVYPLPPLVYRMGCVLLLSLGLCQPEAANAALLIEEPFNYGLGQLVQQASPPWYIGGPAITLESGSLTSPAGLLEPTTTGNLVQLNTNIAAQLAYRLFPQVTSGSVYVSLLLRQTLMPSTTGGCIIGLYDGNTLSFAAGNVSAALGVHVRRWTATTWQVGIRKGQGTTVMNGDDMWAPPVNFGETVFVVAKYQFNIGAPDTVALWVNPPSSSFGNSEPAPVFPPTDSAVSTDASGLVRVFFRTWGTQGSGISQLDNIRIGPTWADVTPTDAAPLHILSVERLQPTEVKLVWESTPGKTYVIESRDDLAAGNWTTNGTITATDSTTAFTNSSIPGIVAQRYYRVGRTP